MQLSDTEIAKLGESMITPFYPEQVRSVAGTPRISFGLTCAGYDIRLDPAHGLKYFSLASRAEIAIDPKMFDPSVLEPLRLFNNLNTDEAWWEVPGFGYVMGLSAETFSIPRDIVGQVQGKSTYARCGLIVNVTPAEPGWKGRLVVEISNTQSRPVRVYAGEGIAQMCFHRLSSPVAVSYADRDGKYQNQESLTYAKV